MADDVVLDEVDTLERCLARVREEFRDDPRRLDAGLSLRLQRMVGFRGTDLHREASLSRPVQVSGVRGCLGGVEEPGRALLRGPGWAARDAGPVLEGAVRLWRTRRG